MDTQTCKENQQANKRLTKQRNNQMLLSAPPHPAYDVLNKTEVYKECNQRMYKIYTFVCYMSFELH